MESSALNFVAQWVVSALAVFITARIVPGFRVDGFGSALIAAVAIGLANAVVWPVLIILTLPLNFVTLGLFTFVVNGATLKICAALVPGFAIDGWWAAIVGSVVLSLTGMALHWAFA